jgi:hypothetical protein
MSILGDFIAAVAPTAQTVIGTETLSIGGGSAIAGTFNEARYSRDYESGGFEPEASLDFVVLESVFTAAYPLAVATYHGKAATGRGESWRIGTITKGASFVTVSLVATNKSA